MQQLAHARERIRSRRERELRAKSCKSSAYLSQVIAKGLKIKIFGLFEFLQAELVVCAKIAVIGGFLEPELELESGGVRRKRGRRLRSVRFQAVRPGESSFAIVIAGTKIEILSGV